MPRGGFKKKEKVETTDTAIAEEQTFTIENATPIITNLPAGEQIVTTEQLKNTTSTEKINGKEMEVVFQVQNNMSEQAVKWEKYITMYNYTPKTFLERYPYHVHRKFIEEIIAFRKSNS